MNKTISKGRLTADPKITYTQGGKAKAEFVMALDRYGEGADFPRFIAWENKAEFVEKYCRKGKEFLIEGRIQTGSFDGKNGKVYTTDIIVERIEFCGKKDDVEKSEEYLPDGDGFMKIPDGVDEELPFS